MSTPSSTLGSVVSDNAAPQIDPSFMSPSAAAPSVASAQRAMDADEDDRSSGGGGSRLLAILGAVAKVGSVGMAGAANQKGRASFTGGLVGGANAELQDQANQHAIKMKD